MSPARRERAERTRARIIETARSLLLRGGLATMTIADLARAAQVSPQTVYNAIGGKAEVVKAAYDVTLAGDDDGWREGGARRVGEGAGAL